MAREQGNRSFLDNSNYPGAVILEHTQIALSGGVGIMKVSNTWVQHITNPLHVYCRLIDCGFSEGISKRLSVIYEDIFIIISLKTWQRDGVS
jgi:hypothetical protein